MVCRLPLVGFNSRSRPPSSRTGSSRAALYVKSALMWQLMRLFKTRGCSARLRHYPAIDREQWLVAVRPRSRVATSVMSTTLGGSAPPIFG